MIRISQLPIDKICHTYGLGQPTSIFPVAGGLLHQVFFMQTSQGNFAVKCLADQTFEQLGHNLLSPDSSQEVASIMQKNGVPTVAALKHKNKFYIKIDGYTFMVFPWITGSILSSSHITLGHIMMIGKVLAKIHLVNLKGRFSMPHWPGLTKKEWQGVMAPLEHYDLEIVDRLKAEIKNLIKWSKEAKDAVLSLKDNLIFSHRDLDNKNVMWGKDSTLTLLDWEYAGNIHPSLDLLIVALNWSDVLHGKITKEKFTCLMQGFCEQKPVIKSLNQQIWGGYFGYCLDWLIYNVKELPNNELAAQAISQSLLALHAVENKKSEITSWFNQFTC